MKYLKKYIYLLSLPAILAGILASCKNEELTIVTYPEPTVTGFGPTTGRFGEQVTISGMDFGEYAPAVSVFFSGVEATVDTVTDTQIALTVPNDAISGSITVKVWTHEVVTEAEFSVVPGAVISALSATSGNGGDLISIRGESFGTNPDDVAVYFRGGEDGVAAEIVSVSDTEIVVIVPLLGITGALRVVVGPQEIEGPVFTYPFEPIDFLFDNAGDAEGWATTNNSISMVDFGVLRASFDMGVATKRADFAFSDNIRVHAGIYPILAIRIIDKPASGNFILDTNLGQYKNGSNNWEGVLDDNVYYYDLRNHFGADSLLSQTIETLFTTLQWKIADVTTDESAYFVDWVKSFTSETELENYVAAQYPGQQWYGFTEEGGIVDPTQPGDWIGRMNQDGTTTVIEDGFAKVTFKTPSDGAVATRADFNYSHGGNFGSTEGPDQAPWEYHPDYPIYAIKIHFVQNDGSLGGARPATGTVRYDRLGDFDDTYSTSNSVLWVDATTWGGTSPKTETSWWAVIIADILSDEQGYWVDWHRSYRSVEEMEFFLGI